MNKRVFGALGLLLLVSLRSSLSEEASKEPKSVDEVVSTLRKCHLPVRHVPAKNLTVEALAGQYSNRGAFLDLAGNELYLFHDATYFYTTWADIIPATVCDKGTWAVKGGSLVLKSDGTVSAKEKPKDTLYWPLLKAGSTDVNLMGNREFSSFVAEERSQDEVIADIWFWQYTFSQQSRLSKVAAEKKRKELLPGLRKPASSKDGPNKR
jgi:hypothetical protein